jgi:hypothetical protein
MSMQAKGLNLAAVAWLYFAALQAPFAHYHPEDPDHHHATGLSHLHLGHVADHHLDVGPEGPELDHGDEDESAISQEWAPVASPRIDVVYEEVTPASVVEVHFVAEGVTAEFVVRSHDPPDLFASPARAPPV